jgi:predicted Zn finger-like uncharacterized protein
MDVRCDQCGIIYEFDDSRVGQHAITVKCSSCGHVFKVFKQPETQTPTDEPAGARPVPAAKAEAKAEDEKRWMIRKPSGETFRFRELTTLQQWIVELKVSREDEISKSGKVWERLGAIKELEPFFALVDKARRAEEDRGTARPQPASDTDVEPGAAGAAPTIEFSAPRDLQVATKSEPFEMGSNAHPVATAEPEFSRTGLDTVGQSRGAEPAWAPTGNLRVHPGARDDSTEVVTHEDDLEAVQRGPAHLVRTVAMVVIGLMVGFGGFLVIAKWDRVKQLFSGKRETLEASYVRGRTQLRLDTDESLARAAEAFEKTFRARGKDATVELRANARAGQAEVLAARAQYLRDDADDALAETAGGAAGGAAASEPRRARTPPDQEAPRALAQQALAYAEEACSLARTGQTVRALAEASRVAGKPVREVRALLQEAATLLPGDPESEYVQAMLLYDGKDLEGAQRRLRLTIEMAQQRIGRPLFRAQMRLARIYALRGLRDEAITALEALLSQNAGHLRAQQLLDRLRASPSVAAVKPAVDAGAPDAGAARPDAGTPADVPGAGGAEPTGTYDELVRRGEQFSYGGNQARAMTYYQKALTLQPSGVEALTGIGYCHLDQGRLGDAIASFRRALGVSAGYGEALIGLAETYQRQGNARGALEHYQRYLKHHPSGRRAVLAKQNIRELEEKLGKTPDDAMTEPMDEPMDRPVEPMDRPVEPMDRPAEPMDRPVEPMDRPVEPMDRPAEPMDRPAEPMDRPVVREPPPAEVRTTPAGME